MKRNNLEYLTFVENSSGLCRLNGDCPIELKIARNRIGKLGQALR